MSEITRNFIKASIIYLLIGVLLGGTIAILPSISGDLAPLATQLRPAHAHINLLGWVSMLMFGVAYHIIPRFHGRMLHSDPMSVVHFWLANVGLVGMAFAMYLQSGPLIGVFGTVWSAGAVLFAYNLFKTMAGAAATGGPAK